MKRYHVEYDVEAELDLTELVAWVARKTSYNYSQRYINRIFNELETLSYLAPMLQESQFDLPKLYHPDANTMTIGKRKLTAIYHIDGDYVIVDKIIPSSMMH